MTSCPIRELPGRTLTFDFDFAMFAASNINQSRNQSHDQQPPPAPPLNLIKPNARKELHHLIHYFNEGNSSHAPPRNAAAAESRGASAAVDWKRPYLSQARTRQRLFALLATMAVPAHQQRQQQQ